MSEKKRILILTAGFGEGHNTAARNLKTAWEHAFPHQVEVSLCDVCHRSSAGVNQLFRQAYLGGIHYTPWLWSSAFALIHRTRFIQDNLWMFQHQTRTLEALLKEVQPHLLVSTYPLYGHLLTALPPQPFKHFCIVTDSITLNSIWHTYPCDGWITPNDATQVVLLERGVEPSKVHPLGFPVQLDFIPEHNPVPRPSAQCPPSVLLIVNAKEYQAEQTLKKLLAIKNLRITVAAGRNEALVKRLKAVSEPYPGRANILGWVNNIPQLLLTHHLVISKAGGATVQEAIAAQCPMIINQIVPGQEEGNYHLIRDHGLGTFADEPQTIADTVGQAFENNATQWKRWKANFHPISKPDASLRIAEFLLSQI
jgi:UDP-N-acetylglucosamine:LPS N-acetylglucosamine transferase